MIRINLDRLLAEKGLTITKVFRDTGISRTTLTALYYNRAKGIQFSTLETLCEYLNVEPAEIITYSGSVERVCETCRHFHHAIPFSSCELDGDTVDERNFCGRWEVDE